MRRAHLLRIAISLILTSVMTVNADFEKGQTYFGFELKEKRFVKEVNATCLLFEHTRSGARLLKIASDDDNKTFSVAFKTVPESDAGTPHIMEHSVLNGSKNFPVKSPFDVLAKGSLNTFLNAMTGSDVTIYPVASMNDKDYFNLMHVYLDAVFNPLIYNDPRILKQEGWHHELTDAQAPVVYKGVVYNEMKGAYSNPTRELDYQVGRHLFPDNGYRFSSGGYPKAIPSLSLEAFLDYHRKYYHPSNSYIFLYGDADLSAELQFIDREYLSSYQRSDAQISLPLQQPFAAMKRETAFYPVAAEADTVEQTYLAVSYVCGTNIEQKLVIALDVLADVLVNQESGPIRIALQKQGIGKEVHAMVDPMQQNMFQIYVQNADSNDDDRFLAVIREMLAQLVRDGLDRQAAEGTLNRLEFRLREGDDAQKGLTYNFRALNGWFFAQDPFLGLEWEKPLAALKKEMHEGYLEKVIQDYLLDNNHALLLTMKPQPGLESVLNDEVSQELGAFKASLSQEEIGRLVEETRELLDYQQREDDPAALATIPLLDLQDINPKTEWYDVAQSQVDGVKLLHHATFTNNVVYARFYFGADVLPVELLPYAALLGELFASMNTQNYTYEELDTQLNLHTGGFSSFISHFIKEENEDNLLPLFIVQGKAMKDKTAKMLELIEEILHRTIIDDEERLKEVLTRHQSRLESHVKSNGLDIARNRVRSYYSTAGFFAEKTDGLDYYWFITDLVKAFDANYASIVRHLQETVSLLFNRDNLTLSLTCSDEDIAAATEAMRPFIATLADEKAPAQQWTFEPDKKNEGLLAASKVQYVLQGYNFKKLGYEWSGKMRVLNQILSRDWLNNQIRVIGGAYGGYSQIQPSGDILFVSYRDPNLTETLDNYKKTVDYLQTFAADDETMTRFIIGTIARMDQPLTPSQKGNAAVRYYFEKYTPEKKQRDRAAVLATKTEDIRAMSQLIADFIAQNAYCVYGNEEKLQANTQLFGELKATTK